MKIIKVATLILFLLIAGGGGVALWYVFRPLSASVASKKVDIVVQELPVFLAEFEVDEDAANAFYLNKIIEVQGIVSDLNKEFQSLSLFGNDLGGEIICNFQENYKIPDIEKGQRIKVKGYCAGNQILDVVLTRCAIEVNGKYYSGR